MKRSHHFLALVILGLTAFSVVAEDAAPYLGRWALTIPGGRAGWLEIRQESGYLDGSILWGGGSVVPVASVYVKGDTLYVTRTDTVERKDADGTVVRTQQFTETITGTLSDRETMVLTQEEVRANGLGVERASFEGKRIADLPPAPDLSKVKFGAPIVLFNGLNLEGWTMTDDRVSGWGVADGLLVNDPAQEEGKPHIRYGNLRTEREFEDFNITLEVKVPEKGNSGVYLRGIYEVQVMDSYGMEIDPHHMGGVYSRIAPSAAVEKPAGEWQTMDITLVDRHITVKLNGTLIIDNAPLPGCTGGALWSDEFRPGPIYLQGDHTGVSYRNIVLRPVEK